MNHPTYNYKIYFQPLDYFFFGGEQTFGEGERTNYFAKSNVFPQQTTILGVLRHLGYKEKFQIGTSFEHDNKTPDFGFIKKISPVFFAKPDAKTQQLIHYLPGPLGDSKTGLPFPVLAMEDGKRVVGNKFEASYLAKGYDPKNGTVQKLYPQPDQGGKVDKNDLIDVDELIEKQAIIGIKKTIHKGGQTRKVVLQEQQDGFFKQEVIRMKNQASFVVLATLEEQETPIPKRIILPIGGQKMQWCITLEKLGTTENGLANYFPSSLFEHTYPSELKCFFLTSDAYLSSELYQKSQFAITASKDFRYIHTPKATTNFARMKSYSDWGLTTPADQLRKSQKYNLIQRGSLLYGKKETIKKMLDIQPWQTIGYNHYFEI